jgi:flagellar basal-body rod modification protein FlgD
MATTTSVSTSVTPAASLDPSVQAALDASNLRQKKSTLNADDFLRLLTVQLQNQDPLKPMEDAQFMGQMAQFAALEQTRDLNSSFSAFTKQQAFSSATQFLGKLVTLNTPGGMVVGTVSSVKISSEGPMVVVNGIPYATDSIVDVQVPASSNGK